MKNKQFSRRSAFVLMDEAIYLLRHAGVRPLFFYYLGTLPFFLLLLQFWSDMSSPLGEGLRVPESFLLAAAFLWMKSWQTFFCGSLYSFRLGRPDNPITGKRFVDVARKQLAHQPFGLFLIPFSMLAVLPFGRVHAYYQNLTVLGTVEKDPELVRKARRLAAVWPGQNMLVIWLLSPWLLAVTIVLCFGLAAVIMQATSFFDDQGLTVLSGMGQVPWFFIGVVGIIFFLWPSSPLALTLAANIALLFAALPYLAHTLFGIETMLLRASIYGFANSTMVLAVYCTTHLLLDPLLKAAYTLRCFYGSAVDSGIDILTDLKPFAAAAGAVALGCALVIAVVTAAAGGLPVEAAATPPPAEQIRELTGTPILAADDLDEAITRVLQKREYSWQLPRAKQQIAGPKGTDVSWLGKLLAPVGNFLVDIGKWLAVHLEKIFSWLGHKVDGLVKWLVDLLFSQSQEPAASSFSLVQFSQGISYVLLIAAAVVCFVLLYRTWRVRQVNPVLSTGEIVVMPDLENDATTADELPEQDWRALAQGLLHRGDYRLALRAFFFAGLAFLDQHGLIAVRPAKSNRQYFRELSRRSHNFPELPRIFMDNIQLFERCWYGNEPVDRELIAGFTANETRLRKFLG